MTSKQQKKLQKRKVREKETKTKLRKEREARQAKDKVVREEFRRQKLIQKTKKDMAETASNFWSDAVYQNLPMSTLEQLRHNAKVLRVLEQEYEEEAITKQALNDQLASEGYHTLDQKLNALHQETAEQQKMAIGGCADCLCAPKEIADVEVVKAPPKDS